MAGISVRRSTGVGLCGTRPRAEGEARDRVYGEGTGTDAHGTVIGRAFLPLFVRCA